MAGRVYRWDMPTTKGRENMERYTVTEFVNAVPDMPQNTQEGIAQARETWADVARERGWYVEPFGVQVWVDAGGLVTDSVSWSGLHETIILPDSERK